MQTTLQILQVIVGDCRDTVGVLDHVDGDNFIALHCIALNCIALYCIANCIALLIWQRRSGVALCIAQCATSQPETCGTGFKAR